MSRTLYKYFPLLTDEHLDRVARLLGGQIYISSPVSFNDPFELRPALSAPRQEDVFGPLGSVANAISPSARKKLHCQLSTELVRKDAVSIEWLKSLGVLCLTEKPDNLLMWAHYGSNHTGLCVGFSSETGPFTAARPVTYATERPKVQPFDRAEDRLDDLLERVLFTKSAEWQYEAEWRVVKRPVRSHEIEYYSAVLKSDSSQADAIAELLATEGGPGQYDYDLGSLTRIYIGARMNSSYRDRVLNLVRESQVRPRVFQLSIDSGYFRLNRRLLKG